MKTFTNENFHSQLDTFVEANNLGYVAANGNWSFYNMDDHKQNYFCTSREEVIGFMKGFTLAKLMK